MVGGGAKLSVESPWTAASSTSSTAATNIVHNESESHIAAIRLTILTAG